MAKLVECIPNFSVSRESDLAVFEALSAAAAGVRLPPHLRSQTARPCANGAVACGRHRGSRPLRTRCQRCDACISAGMLARSAHAYRRRQRVRAAVHAGIRRHGGAARLGIAGYPGARARLFMSAGHNEREHARCPCASIVLGSGAAYSRGRRCCHRCSRNALPGRVDHRLGARRLG